MTKYTNINPLRAGLVSTFAEPERYSWSRHAAVIGRIRYALQNRDYVPGVSPGVVHQIIKRNRLPA
jgi:putative transposase